MAGFQVITYGRFWVITEETSKMLDDLKGTDVVYRELARVLSKEEDDDGVVHVRFLIDVISGLSGRFWPVSGIRGS